MASQGSFLNFSGKTANFADWGKAEVVYAAHGKIIFNLRSNINPEL